MLMAHEERIFKEVMYPNLLLRFQQISDEGAQKIVDGVSGGTTVRDRAFKILLDKITPPHLLTEGVETRAALKVLPMLTPRAAEGLIQAAEKLHLEGPIWTASRLPVLWPHVVAISEGA